MEIDADNKKINWTGDSNYKEYTDEDMALFNNLSEQEYIEFIRFINAISSKGSLPKMLNYWGMKWFNERLDSDSEYHKVFKDELNNRIKTTLGDEFKTDAGRTIESHLNEIKLNDDVKFGKSNLILYIRISRLDTSFNGKDADDWYNWFVTRYLSTGNTPDNDIIRYMENVPLMIGNAVRFSYLPK